MRRAFFTFLKIRVTLAHFHSVGKITVLINFVNICVSDDVTMLEAIFKSLLGILSRSADFLAFSLSKSLRTTFSFHRKSSFGRFEVGLRIYVRRRYL